MNALQLARVPSATISQLGFDCQEHFLAVIEAVRKRREHTEPESTNVQATVVALEEELGRFRMWANDIGTMRRDQGSLESMLINMEYLRNNVKELLEDLRSCLNDVNSTLAQIDESPVPSNSSGDEASDGESDERKDSDDNSFLSNGDSSSEILPCVRQFYKEVVDIIDKLFQLSIFIRGSSRTLRTDKAAAYVEEDEIGNDVLPTFKRFVRMKIAADAPSAPKWLVNRLTDTITMRRQQFYYQRAHKRQVSTTILTHGSALDDPSIAGPTVRTGFATEMKTPVVAKSVKTIHHTSMESRTLTKTTATTAAEPPADILEERPTVTLPNLTKTEIIRNRGTLPGPPKEPPDKDFECHQCFYLLPANYRHEDLWTKHLFSDLRPYQCIVRNCTKKLELYETRDEWAAHEQSHFSEWVCDIEHNDSPSGLIFTSEDEYKTHLRQHDISVADHQEPFLLTQQRLSPFPFRFCPFCNDPNFDLQNIDTLYEVVENQYLHIETSRNLQKHIALHLFEFSTLALLEPGEDCVESLNAQTAANNPEDDVDSWHLSSVSLTFDHITDITESGLSFVTLEDELSFVPELIEPEDWSYIAKPWPESASGNDEVLLAFTKRFQEQQQKQQVEDSFASRDSDDNSGTVHSQNIAVDSSMGSRQGFLRGTKSKDVIAGASHSETPGEDPTLASNSDSEQVLDLSPSLRPGQDLLKGLRECHRIEFESKTFIELRSDLDSEAYLYHRHVLYPTFSLVDEIQTVAQQFRSLLDIQKFLNTVQLVLKNTRALCQRADELYINHHHFMLGNLRKLEERIFNWGKSLPDDDAVKAAARKRDTFFRIPSFALGNLGKKRRKEREEQELHHATGAVACLTGCCKGLRQMLTGFGNALSGIGTELKSVMRTLNGIMHVGEQSQGAVIYKVVQKESQEVIHRCDEFYRLRISYYEAIEVIEAKDNVRKDYETAWLNRLRISER